MNTESIKTEIIKRFLIKKSKEIIGADISEQEEKATILTNISKRDAEFRQRTCSRTMTKQPISRTMSLICFIFITTITALAKVAVSKEALMMMTTPSAAAAASFIVSRKTRRTRIITTSGEKRSIESLWSPFQCSSTSALKRIVTISSNDVSYPHQKYHCNSLHMTTASLSTTSTTSNESNKQTKKQQQQQHNNNNNKKSKPHEQRTSKPRTARRLNHPFQHLHRHDNIYQYGPYEGNDNNNNKNNNNNSSITSSTELTRNMTALEYLLFYGGYEKDEVMNVMTKQFPPLLDLNVTKHLRPKMRFLKYTLGGVEIVDDAATTSNSNDNSSKPRQLSKLGKTGIPPQYYGARLEKTVAPRHAFLRHVGLPHGSVLLQENGKLMKEFLVSSRRTKQFCALCNTWRRKYGYYYYYRNKDGLNGLSNDDDDDDDKNRRHGDSITPQKVVAFDALFQRGLMAAARNDLMDGDGDDENDGENTRHLANITSGELIHLLVYSGANPLERDVRGASLLHWAAGTGNLDGLVALCESISNLETNVHNIKNDSPQQQQEEEESSTASIAAWTRIKRDGATTLHWAAAGAKSKEFGCGGHAEICRFLLDSIKSSKERKLLANAQTKDGNSVLMWAAWSGTLEVVKLLVRHRADASLSNRNGCTVAHWASSGGNLDVCRYLYRTVGVDFTTKNYAGNTPLSHAVAYGRVDVVQWLREELKVEDDDGIAQDLALDFLGWEGNVDTRRQKVFDLFQDWDYDASSSSSSSAADSDFEEKSNFDVFD